MIEVKVLMLVTKLQAATKRCTLHLLNKRSIRALAKYNKQEEYIANSRKFLDSMEDHIEEEYQRKDNKIVEAHRLAKTM